MKYILIFLLFMVLSCKNGQEKAAGTEADSKTEEVSKTGPEYTSKYICPMHCKGSGSDTTGVCPECGMDYVLNEKKDDGHNHEHHDHDGHDHSKDGHSH